MPAAILPRPADPGPGHRPDQSGRLAQSRAELDRLIEELRRDIAELERRWI